MDDGAGRNAFREEIVLKKQGIEVYADRFQTDPGLEKVVFDGQSRWKFPAR